MGVLHLIGGVIMLFGFIQLIAFAGKGELELDHSSTHALLYSDACTYQYDRVHEHR